MTEVHLYTDAFDLPSADSQRPSTRRSADQQPRVDFAFPNSTDGFLIRLDFDERDEDVVVMVSAAEGEGLHRVHKDLARQGLGVLLARESRLELVAGRYGLPVDTMLDSLEQSVVDLDDASAGIPEAELTALRDAGIDLGGSPEDPSGAAQVLVGLARLQGFREEALTTAEAAKLLEVSPSRVRQLISAGEVVTISSSEGHRLPAWQFVGGQLVPGLADLVAAIGDIHPLTLAAFMSRPDVDLVVLDQPVSPVQWLLGGGDVQAVVDLAAGLAVQS